LPIISGFGGFDMKMRNGKRSDTFQAFLEPIMGKRKNLKIIRYAHAHKVV
jgi:hypothetical protein